MNTDRICIATITWARNKEEEKTLRSSLQQLALHNLPVFVTDGGSEASFVQFLQELPNVQVLKADRKGVHAQAENSLQAAYKTGAPFLLYTEPDKEEFFKTGLFKLLSQVEADNSLGIRLAARSAKGFGSFPSFQQMTETTINNCCSEITGQLFDYTFGPFLLNRNLVPYLNKLPEDVGWGWRPYLFSLANRLGLRIEALVDDFYCPPDQRADDAKERIYRMRQLEQNIRGIVHSTDVVL